MTSIIEKISIFSCNLWGLTLAVELCVNYKAEIKKIITQSERSVIEVSRLATLRVTEATKWSNLGVYVRFTPLFPLAVLTCG